MPNRHKNWLVHKQTACGKDFSNPFMVDNLPKIVGLSTYRASVVKSWLVHDQTVHVITPYTQKEIRRISAWTSQGNAYSHFLIQQIVHSKAAYTGFSFPKSPEFLWAEAIATACFTQNRFIVHTRYNKTPYELIRGRKPNVQYFHVFRSLCYSTSDHDHLGKMKLKADIGIFIGYSESSKGFRIYNRLAKKIMEMIHVKFDELTTMASECNNSEPGFNCTNFQDSSKDSQLVPSKTNLDNLFGPLYEEYYATSPSEVSDNSAAHTLDNDDTSSSSSIVVEEDEASQIVSSSAEQVASEPNL
ncbi:retrovirus-related pol polyprotein from transposon TNT 1-94 [Tanacetum coccineum]